MNRVFQTSKNKDYSHLLFFGILLSYCWQYAALGINETDGGFITAYAWRLLNGEIPYRDFIYVRPPASLYLRALEMQLMPEAWELYSERLFFYGKMALTAWLGAALLLKGAQRWWVATLAFVIGVHNYPAAAWHTIDGILFAVWALYWLAKPDRWWGLGLVCAFVSMLCKQSFYPLLLVSVGLVTWLHGWRKGGLAALGLLGLWGLLVGLLAGNDLLEPYLEWTSGASSIGEAIERGLFDYFRLNPYLLGISLLLIPAFIGRSWKRMPGRYFWYLFLVLLVAGYGWRVYENQDFTVPVKESRLLFLLSMGYLVIRFVELWRTGLRIGDWEGEGEAWVKLASLLSVSWMASISWGYNFPILFSVPFVLVGLELTKLFNEDRPDKYGPLLRLFFLTLLLFVFRYGYQFIYRDGARPNMTCQLGPIFPKLNYLKSTSRTCGKYQELKNMQKQYGDCFSVLPSFPLAHYLTNTQNPLPLDWVIRPEYNGQLVPLQMALKEMNGCVILVEKNYGAGQLQEPKFELTKKVEEEWRLLEKGRYFKVYKRLSN